MGFGLNVESPKKEKQDLSICEATPIFERAPRKPSALHKKQKQYEFGDETARFDRPPKSKSSLHTLVWEKRTSSSLGN